MSDASVLSFGQRRDFVLAARQLNRSEQLVLLALNKLIGQRNTCWPSMADLETATYLSRRSVKRAVKGLRAAGLLHTRRLAHPLHRGNWILEYRIVWDAVATLSQQLAPTEVHRDQGREFPLFRGLLLTEDDAGMAEPGVAGIAAPGSVGPGDKPGDNLSPGPVTNPVTTCHRPGDKPGDKMAPPSIRARAEESSSSKSSTTTSELMERLRRARVVPKVATRIVATCPPERIDLRLREWDAVQHRLPRAGPGLLVRSIEDDFEIWAPGGPTQSLEQIDARLRACERTGLPACVNSHHLEARLREVGFDGLENAEKEKLRTLWIKAPGGRRA